MQAHFSSLLPVISGVIKNKRENKSEFLTVIPLQARVYLVAGSSVLVKRGLNNSKFGDDPHQKGIYPSEGHIRETQNESYYEWIS